MKAKFDVSIRKYQSSDKPSIVKCMEEFGDYLAAIDSMKRTRCMPGFGEYFTQKMLDETDKNNGVIYVAEHEGRIIGFIAGIILRQSKEDLLQCIPSTAGRIIELFVDQQFRGQNIGTTFMKKMEKYFRQAGCDVSRVEVFEPNVEAHNFYRKRGYHDRSFDMIKKL